MNAPVDIRGFTNMTSKGQVLIPKEVRDAIGLVPGQTVAVGINARHEAVVLPGPARAGETPAQRRERLVAVLERARSTPLFSRPADEVMRDLRADEPLP